LVVPGAGRGAVLRRHGPGLGGERVEKVGHLAESKIAVG
jgi:hypothetical protein